LNSQVTVHGDDEIADLARAFNAMAEKLGETEMRRRRFVADASHELQTPLSAVKVLAETIESSFETDPQAAQEFLRDLIAETDRMSELVRELLESARLDAAPEGLVTEKLDLLDAAAETVHRLQPLAEHKQVAIVLKGTPVLVLGDRQKLQRLLLNLLDNAIKFAPSGSEVRVSVALENQQAVMEVVDDGPGMDPNELKRIFDRFYRVDTARSRRVGGTGLGLAIARQIVLAHGGTIRADNQPGAGTKITVQIPVAGEHKGVDANGD
jgi:signal transduction histidine kinase